MRLFCVVMSCVVLPQLTAAQTTDRPLHVGVLAAAVSSGELDTTDTGVGVQLAWHPMPLVGAEVEVAIHPADMGAGPAFSSGRIETLFGVSVGPRLDWWRPFGKVRPGIIRFWPSPEPVACIAVFPPPVRCTLAAGRTVVALDLGGGVELFPTARTFLRIDASDRLLSFPGPVFDSGGTRRESGYFAHDFRFTIGIGARFPERGVP